MSIDFNNSQTLFLSNLEEVYDYLREWSKRTKLIKPLRGDDGQLFLYISSKALNGLDVSKNALKGKLLSEASKIFSEIDLNEAEQGSALILKVSKLFAEHFCNSISERNAFGCSESFKSYSIRLNGVDGDGRSFQFEADLRYKNEDGERSRFQSGSFSWGSKKSKL